MIVSKTREDAESGKRRAATPTGLQFSVTPYFGANASDPTAAHPDLGELHPVAVRVDQDPDTVNAPHFHQANQFQVFVGGSGRIGTSAVSGVCVHYAGAYSPYGPLCAGSDGLSYFVFRNSWDPIAQYMPKERALLKASGRKPRNAVGPALEAPHAGRPATTTVTDALPSHADGLAAWRYRVAPGEHITGPDPATGGGQFWLVLAGTDCAGATPLGPMSALFVSPDESARPALAGPDGLDVVALQFPRFGAV